MCRDSSIPRSRHWTPQKTIPGYPHPANKNEKQHIVLGVSSQPCAILYRSNGTQPATAPGQFRSLYRCEQLCVSVILAVLPPACFAGSVSARLLFCVHDSVRPYFSFLNAML